MSKLVYWIIILGVYFIYHIIKSMSSKHDDVQGTPIGSEVFPRIDIYDQTDTEATTEHSSNSKTDDIHKKSAPKPAVKTKPAKSATKAPAVMESKNEKTKISLKNKSEAKRAFIHAEILKRKY